MLIASAKSWSGRGASHQPAFMSLTISHTCLPCLPSGRTLLFWSDLFVVGMVESWESYESSELGRWERCMRVVRCQGGKGGRIVRWQDRRGGLEWGGKFGKVGEEWGDKVGGSWFYARVGDKIMLYCFREVKCKQGFTKGTWYYLYNCLGITNNRYISGLKASCVKLPEWPVVFVSRESGYELNLHFF